MRLAILEVRFSSSMNWHFLSNFAESIRGLRVAAFKINFVSTWNCRKFSRKLNIIEFRMKTFVNFLLPNSFATLGLNRTILVRRLFSSDSVRNRKFRIWTGLKKTKEKENDLTLGLIEENTNLGIVISSRIKGITRVLR